jgi:rRNA maturation endonuclease Nob1
MKNPTPKEVETYRCQFCEKESPVTKWTKDRCPKCGRVYDVLLAQDSEE